MERIWIDAITRVLKESKTPLHYIKITHLIISSGFYKTNGISPKNAVNRLLTVSVKYDPKSPFVRVERGVYGMKKPTTTPNKKSNSKPKKTKK